MPCKQMVTNCWDENQQLQPWLFVCHLKRCPVDKSRFTSILSQFNANWSHALFDTNLKIPEIIIEFPHLELTSDARQFVPLWGLSDFLSNRAGFREEVHPIQLAEKVSRPPDKHDSSPSGMAFFRSIAIICHANMKRLSLGYMYFC